MRVLFMQSQSFFGSDSGIHALMMRHFDRRFVLPYVALTTEDHPDPAVNSIRHVHSIPGIQIRPTDFGPSLFGIRGLARAKRLATTPVVPFHLLSLASYIRREGIDIIHGTEKPRDAFFGVLLGKLTGAKSVIHLHVGYEEWISAPAQWAIQHADAVVGVSRFVAQTAIDAGVPPERVHHVVNGLDLSSTKWDPSRDGRLTRMALGLPEDALVIGIASRLFSWKGHHHLIDALPQVQREVPNAHLVIVGEDDPRAQPGGGSYRANLETQVARLGLQRSVTFTGFRTDVPDLMATFDVFAMPTWEEPCAVAFIEAMAMAKPVVAWDSGGTPELVVHGETGLLAPRGNVEALAGALVQLLRDSSLRRQFGEAGRRRVEDVLTPQRMCREMTAVYQKLIKRPISISA
jgi:glycosyltransferase involved in cell wall biosynthesis